MAEQWKQPWIDRLGAEATAHYQLVRDEMAQLADMWRLYRDTYDAGQDQLKLLNETAKDFFGIVQQAIGESLMMQLARLTDPWKMKTCDGKERENVCLQGIVELIADTLLQQNFREELKEITKKTDFCRRWRNLYLAHADKNLLLGISRKPPQEASLEKFGEAICAIQTFLNDIGDQKMSWDVKLPHGTSELIYFIKDGWRMHKIKEQERRRVAGLADQGEV